MAAAPTMSEACWLDCIASGAIWVDMKATGVDVVGHQGGPPCAGVVVMRAAAKSLALQQEQ